MLYCVRQCKVCLFYEGTLSVPTQGVPQVPTQNRQSVFMQKGKYAFYSEKNVGLGVDL
jgi:hypothetical protein